MTKKEVGTIVFALEQYCEILENNQEYILRNKVYEIIWKLQGGM
jgi:hypothetical protein